MADEIISGAAVLPSEPDNNSDALVKASALFLAAESDLVTRLQQAEALGAHDEYASLRGTLKTTLQILRCGRPGGN